MQSFEHPARQGGGLVDGEQLMRLCRMGHVDC